MGSRRDNGINRRRGSNSCQTFNSAADKRLLYLIPGKRNIVNQACLTAGSGILAVRALSRQQNGYRHE
ncbi:hypothetical protein DKN52_16305 [Salmonella enterica]|nr:hypothetical protein [Salmonella enterica]